MTEDLSSLADRLVPAGRRPGVALGFVDIDGTFTTVVRPGRLPFDEATFFEIGSLGKTMTATLLAVLALDGTVALDTTVGDLLGSAAGPAGDVRLEELATHTSGMPRILQSPGRVFRHARDPYRGYDADALLADLATATLTDRGTAAYSNAGFDLLAHCLAVAADQPFARLLEERVLRPAGMLTARCQPCTDAGLAKGRGSRLIGGHRWHSLLAGAGGVDATISDAVAWARANLLPTSTPLEAAIRLAHEPRADLSDRHRIGLAWNVQDDARFHNGGTGRFSSYLVLEPAVGAVVVLENQAPTIRRADRTSLAAVNDWFLARVAAA